MKHQDLVTRAQDLVSDSEALCRQMEDVRQAVADGRGPASRRDALLAVSRELAATARSLAGTTQAMAAFSRELIRRGRTATAESRQMMRRTALLRSGTVPTAGAGREAGAADAVPPVAPWLARLEGYGRISPEDRRRLDGAVARVCHVAPGTDIVVQGTRPAESALLLDGFAARGKLLAGGGRQIMAVHVPGDFVDLHSFLLKPMDHTTMALTGCTVAVVPHATLEAITSASPALARLLWFSTLVDGAVQREWLVAVGRRPARARVGHLLCELFLRLQVVGLAERRGGARSFPLPLTQSHVGDMLGLSSVHVSRTLRELREGGLATWSGGVVTILHWNALARASEFSPDYLYLPAEDA